MRKLELTVLFDTHFKPKGEKGDEIKQNLNGLLEEALEEIDEIVRYEIKSSVRDYKRDSGSITTQFSTHIRDDVDLSGGEVDPINDAIWHYLKDNQSHSIRSKWHLDDVRTDDIDQVTTSVDEENRIRTDLNERAKYTNNGSGETPQYKQMRTLYSHEFNQAFDAIMEQLRERLKLDNRNYKMVKSLVERKPTEWECEQCGRKNVELHHEMVRSAVKKHFRERLSSLDGFVLDEETGEVFMESTTVTRHIAELVHNPEVLTPLCSNCHRGRH